MGNFLKIGTGGMKEESEIGWADVSDNPPGKNLWVDGTLKYWLERITVTDPATNVYGSTLIQVKHLKASGTRGTMTVSRQALTAGVSSADYAMRVSASGADSSLDAASYYLLRHYIYHGTRNHSNGGKITVSFEVASSVADQKVGVVLRQNYGTTGSPTAEEIIQGEIFTLASGVNNISKTFTTNTLTGKTFGTDNNDCLIVDIVVQCGSTIATSLFAGSAFGFTAATTLDFYEFGTYEGEVDYPFVATDDEKNVLARYEKNLLRVLQTIPGCQTAGEIEHMYIPFSERKIKIPTITVYDALGEANCISLSGVGNSYDVTTSENRDGFIVHRDTAGGFYNWMFDWVADARYSGT